MKTSVVALKIPALRGRDAETNKAILELLALEGPQTIWNVNKMLGWKRERYPTIFKALTRLKNRGYVTKTGTVKMKKKKGRTPTYGLTWRGFIASLASDKVQGNVLKALEKNPQLKFPIPKDVVMTVISQMFSGDELRNMVSRLFRGFIESIPLDVESLKEGEYGAYFMPTLMKAKDAFPQEADWNRLTRIPELRNFMIRKLLEQEKTYGDLLGGIRLLKQKLGGS